MIKRLLMAALPASIFAAEPNLDVAQAWLSMLVFFDAVFLTLALWVFGPVMSE